MRFATTQRAAPPAFISLVSSPLPLAVMIEHLWNRMPRTQIYEDLGALLALNNSDPSGDLRQLREPVQRSRCRHSPLNPAAAVPDRHERPYVFAVPAVLADHDADQLAFLVSVVVSADPRTCREFLPNLPRYRLRRPRFRGCRLDDLQLGVVVAAAVKSERGPDRLELAACMAVGDNLPLVALTERQARVPVLVCGAERLVAIA